MAEEALKPSEWEKTFAWIEKLLGFDIPYWIKLPLAVLLLVALVVSVILIVVAGVSKIQELWLEKITPRLYDVEERQRSKSRRLFAQHLAREIGNVNAGENWRDDEFTELEAEVEAEGQRRSWLPRYASRGIRRERSLTIALARSTERLVLVEGEPGSGKSVALRHVGLNLASKASRSGRFDSVLPVYVNLKSLRRDDDVAIDRELIRSHVIKSMNRISDRFVDEFITANFDSGVREGTWFFLFDSFDEVPDVLSSIEADTTVAEYTQAIADFLSGMNACRAVVASRFYRGPEAQGWRKFRILDLSPQRQRQLISKALIVRSSLMPGMMGDLQNAPQDVRNMASNPLLLGLLCEHVRIGHQFPVNAFEVYSKYIASRLTRDAARVTERYAIEIVEVQKIAEEIAFSITADRQIGLSPHRSELWAAMQRQGFRRPRSRVLRSLDALEYMKLGKQDASDRASDPQFTFAHRRFQEYFATSIVVREAGHVAPRTLLLDARWRETAVVVCQTGRDVDTAPILDEISSFLAEATQLVKPQLAKDPSDTPKFAWKPGTIHVLGILQDGYSARMGSLPHPTRKLIGELVTIGFVDGDFLDKKFALEVAGTAPEPDLVNLLRGGLALDSQIINDVVYRQVARLAVPPRDLMTALRTAVLRLTFKNWSTRNRESTNAFVRRVPQAPELADTARLASWVGPVTYILAALVPLPWGFNHSALSVAGLTMLLIGMSIYQIKRHFFSNIIFEFIHLQIYVVVTAFMIIDITKLTSWPEYYGSDVIRNNNYLEKILYLFYYCRDQVLHMPRMDLYLLVWMMPFTVYAFFWPHSAIDAVISGKYMRPLYWPFIPFRRAWSATAALRAGNLSINILIAIFVTVFIGTLFIFPRIFFIFSLVVACLLLLLAIINGRGCVTYYHDAWLTKRWLKRISGSVSGDELGRLYYLLRTERGRAEFLERVQNSGTVNMGATSLGSVHQLACHIDARLAGEPRHTHRPATQRPLGRFWRRVVAVIDASDWSLNRNYLNGQRDSVYLILELNRRLALTDYTAAASAFRSVTPASDEPANPT